MSGFWWFIIGYTACQWIDAPASRLFDRLIIRVLRKKIKNG